MSTATQAPTATQLPAEAERLSLFGELGQAIAADPMPALLWFACLIVALLALGTLAMLVAGWAS